MKSVPLLTRPDWASAACWSAAALAPWALWASSFCWAREDELLLTSASWASWLDWSAAAVPPITLWASSLVWAGFFLDRLGIFGICDSFLDGIGIGAHAPLNHARCFAVSFCDHFTELGCRHDVAHRLAAVRHLSKFRYLIEQQRVLCVLCAHAQKARGIVGVVDHQPVDFVPADFANGPAVDLAGVEDGIGSRQHRHARGDHGA